MEATSPRTVAELIDALGGASAVARLIGKGQSTVGEMKRSGSIKVRYWPKIIAAARAAGPELDWVTSEALMLMHAPQREAAQ
jgi:hypothetical protein